MRSPLPKYTMPYSRPCGVLYSTVKQTSFPISFFRRNSRAGNPQGWKGRSRREPMGQTQPGGSPKPPHPGALALSSTRPALAQDRAGVCLQPTSLQRNPPAGGTPPSPPPSPKKGSQYVFQPTSCSPSTAGRAREGSWAEGPGPGLRRRGGPEQPQPPGTRQGLLPLPWGRSGAGPAQRPRLDGRSELSRPPGTSQRRGTNAPEPRRAQPHFTAAGGWGTRSGGENMTCS